MEITTDDLRFDLDSDRNVCARQHFPTTVLRDDDCDVSRDIRLANVWPCVWHFAGNYLVQL